MEDFTDLMAQVFTVVVMLGALGLVGTIAAIAIAGPQLAPLFQGWPF